LVRRCFALGGLRMGLAFTFAMAAYNLIRLARLIGAATA
jgi:hypothetical protein